MRAYLDNVICSGLDQRDLDPPEEMSATLALVAARDRGEIHLVTSNRSWREQERTMDIERRASLVRNREAVPRVGDDHTVLGFAQFTDRRGTVIAYPLVTDVVDEALLIRLKNEVGLAPDDAYHVMYAYHAKCCHFVTLDKRDILPRRNQIEAVCPDMRVVTPIELARELRLS